MGKVPREAKSINIDDKAAHQTSQLQRPTLASNTSRCIATADTYDAV